MLVVLVVLVVFVVPVALVALVALVVLLVQVVLVVQVVRVVLAVLPVPPCLRALDARRRSHGVLSRHLAPLTALLRTPVYALAMSHPDLRALCRGFCSLDKSALESCEELAPPAALSVLAPLNGLAQGRVSRVGRVGRVDRVGR